VENECRQVRPAGRRRQQHPTADPRQQAERCRWQASCRQGACGCRWCMCRYGTSGEVSFFTTKAVTGRGGRQAVL